MRRTLVKPGQERSRRRWHDSNLEVWSRECSNIIERLEPHDGDKLDFTAHIAPKQIDSPKALNLSAFDAFENFGAKKLLVGVRVLPRRPTVPNAANHRVQPSVAVGYS